MKAVWVIGGGRFGRRAALTLREAYPGAHILVVEKESSKCRELASIIDEVICADGVDFLQERLTPSPAPDWIVPTLPVHLSYAWIERVLSPEERLVPVELPDLFVAALPNSMRGEPHVIYCSIADFLCPADCPAPDSHCVMTGASRRYDLYDHIADCAPAGFLPVVLKSRQLIPGVGGLAPQDMFGALERIRAEIAPILLATASRCHGVISAFRRTKAR